VGALTATVRSGTQWFLVEDSAATGTVRRAAMQLASRLGFSEHRAAEVGIVASEASSNLVAHATRGSVGLQVALRHELPGVQLIAVDHGPGMADVGLSATDGYSTSGTLGVGLGAIRRLATTFDIDSASGRGTVLVAGMWADPAPSVTDYDIGGLTRPIAGEEFCGDAIADRSVGPVHLLMLVDGLGHGPLAADAAQQALSTFYGGQESEPKDVVAAIHRHLNHTRGAAAAVVALDQGYTTARMAGIGNVGAYICEGGRRREMSSMPGIVGHQMRQVRQFEYGLEPDSIVVMHSDGLHSRWDLAASPGLVRRSAGLIAAALLRDAASKPDDASILVLRRAPR
jgi:anti-sigma regulatory factor (Ser/Thr protein kinase)